MRSSLSLPRGTACARAPRCANSSRRPLAVWAGVLEPGSVVLVAGASGGCGQLIAAKLVERGFKVKAAVRPTRASTVLQGYGPNLEVVPVDLRSSSEVERLFEGPSISAVVSAIGTTAFPSARWEGNNGPRPTDLVANANLIEAATKAGSPLARFAMVTSAGVERQKAFPWAILNLFGVLTYKKQAEEMLQQSGLPWTIVRPGRLTDGPYTSYDLNTLLQATSGSRQDVQLCLSDSLSGEASRIASAEAVVQALRCADAENKAFALSSSEGAGPGSDSSKWQALFAGAQP